MYNVVSKKVFCPLLNRKIEVGYCYELCNIATDEILLGDDRVDDWDEAQEICKKCGIYENCSNQPKKEGEKLI